MTSALVADDGSRLPLDVARWRDDVDEVEWAVLAPLPDPVLDVGCGPGRVVRALAVRGRRCLGVDTSPLAAAEARSAGAPVLVRSVFASLPGEGRWGSVVLLDGNVGIGGDPAALLRRVGALLRPGGRALVELGPPGTPTGALTVRVDDGRGRRGPRFAWARVGADRFAGVADDAGLHAGPAFPAGRRWFAEATRP